MATYVGLTMGSTSLKYHYYNMCDSDVQLVVNIIEYNIPYK